MKKYSLDTLAYLKLSLYYPFDITLKYAFCLMFYFKGKYFVMISQLPYQKLFVVSVSVFCLEIFTLKLNLWQKISLMDAISIAK